MAASCAASTMTTIVTYVPRHFKQEKGLSRGFVMKPKGSPPVPAQGVGLLRTAVRQEGRSCRRRGGCLLRADGASAGALVQDAVEATALAGVAGGACRMDEREQRVGVAVVAQLCKLLRVARSGALVPQLLATAAPEPGGALLEREAQRLLVHPTPS